MGCRDLMEPEAEEFLVFWNSNWSTGRPTHWCCVDCRFGCDNDRAKSLKVALRICHMGITRKGIPIALEYRMKYMHEANAKILRCRVFFDILPKALVRMYPVQHRRRALQLQQELLPGQQLGFAGKNAVRASSVLDFFENEDVEKDSCLQAQVLTMPLEHFLSAVFKADAAVTATVQAANFVGLATATDRADFHELTVESFRMNASIVSCTRQLVVILFSNIHRCCIRLITLCGTGIFFACGLCKHCLAAFYAFKEDSGIVVSSIISSQSSKCLQALWEVIVGQSFHPIGCVPLQGRFGRRGQIADPV